MNNRTALWLTGFLLAALSATALAADQTLVAPGTTWRYDDSGQDLGAAWRIAAFDDTGWATGAAELGYGDGDEATVLSFGGNATARHPTYYFRRAFTVVDPAILATLTLRVVRDDGCIVYVNGVEVARSNLAAGAVGFATLATTAVSGADESAWQEFTVDPAVLVPGANVVAVEVHQQSPSSSDVSFDLELLATEVAQPGPTVALVSPPDTDLVNTTSVTFTGTASAPAGLASAELLVGGPPVTLTFSGPAALRDAELVAGTPTTPSGTGALITVDGQSPHAHGLLAVPGLVGTGTGQMPAGVPVASATLRLTCTNPGNPMAIYRLAEDWDEDQATWNERRPGVPWSVPGADGPGSRAGDPVAGDCTTTGQRFIDVTPLVQAWSDGAPNHGLVLVEGGTDGVDFGSSESGDSPVLTVVYHTGRQAVAAVSLTGTSAPVDFAADLPPGTHFWNIRVTDTAGGTATAPADFELAVDPTFPDAPLPLTPPSGAAGTNPDAPLVALASDPSGGLLAVEMALRKAPPAEFTIVVLPDTQFYSQSYPHIFTAQTEWIVANKDARNIVFVTHEGDIVQTWNSVPQWEAADASMSLLDGVLPYGMGPGNHDQPTTLFNQYFPWTRYASEPWYGGHYQDTNDNNFQLFSAGGLDFVVIHLDFCPPAAVVSWADGVLKAHADRIGIVTTHGYLNESAQRTVSGCASTQYLWDGLAVPNPNLHFMLSGHVHDEARRTDFLHGHPVHQMLADYQSRPEGGEGWLRILRFVPAEDRVYVRTWSPWLNRYETDEDSEFSLDFTMGAPLASAGSVSVASGTVALVPSPGLDPDTEYEWQVTVTNAAGKSRSSPLLRFTTGPDVPAADVDADGVPDTSDNCLGLVNAGQCDSDGDGFGNRCDADLSNNGVTNAQDATLFRQQLGQSDPGPGFNAADLNCSGTVNAQDTTLFRQRLGSPPGPSALRP